MLNGLRAAKGQFNRAASECARVELGGGDLAFPVESATTLPENSFSTHGTLSNVSLCSLRLGIADLHHIDKR